MANNVQSMMGVGTPPSQAVAINGIVTSGLTAAGTTQANGTPIQTNYTGFTTVASGTACVLPAGAQPGDEYVVYNGGANALLVFPPVGGAIGTGSANASFSVPAAKGANFFLLTPTTWGVNLSA